MNFNSSTFLSFQTFQKSKIHQKTTHVEFACETKVNPNEEINETTETQTQTQNVIVEEEEENSWFN
jgi:hypothetical protein